jgi:L-aminopeptidase/D-esterase-like protein
VEVIVEDQFWRQGSPFDRLFEAVAEAAEEAALNALLQADISRATLRPLGPKVTRTASERRSTRRMRE